MAEYMHVEPRDIERESFRIIENELVSRGISLDKCNEHIIKRVIHTTADFSYVDTLKFSKGAANIAKELVRRGSVIVTDTNMALSGINKGSIERYNTRAVCFMAEASVAGEAQRRGVTRAFVSMERALALEGRVIVAVGNAPTALISLHEQIKHGARKPDFIIGVPVGFVNVEYSKELFRELDIPYIINFGRKGGSNVAAAIVNAISYSLNSVQEL